MKTKLQLVLLDLDGTLVDSVPDLAYCIDKMMILLGRPPHGDTKVRDWVGNGLERLVRRALTGDLHGEPSESDFAHAYPLFWDLYAVHNTQRATLYPGVKEGLDALHRRSYPLACVTNKAACFVDPVLNALGIRQYFGLVVAGDSLPQKKPDPAPLFYAATHFGVNPVAALMVGDSVNDVLAARAAGFAVTCVTYGYNHGQDIRDAKPDAVIDSLADLPDLIAMNYE